MDRVAGYVEAVRAFARMPTSQNRDVGHPAPGRESRLEGDSGWDLVRDFT